MTFGSVVIPTVFDWVNCDASPMIQCNYAYLSVHRDEGEDDMDGDSEDDDDDNDDVDDDFLYADDDELSDMSDNMLNDSDEELPSKG